ncbi:hypothetical protein [Streptomyces ardesiacus]|uniref:hypothetical protein n=1 Tax=Streptomyces ardesiacus TaxID=285564 RepID=UPI003681688B
MAHSADPGNLDGVTLERWKRNRAHTKNLEALETSFNVVSRSCKDSIRRGAEHEVAALTRTCALLLGATLEDRLMVIVSSPYFSEEAERRVMRESSILDRWKQVLIEAFAARYGTERAKVPGGLPYTAAAYFHGMNSVLDDWVKPLVTVRNSLAHGQWIVAFNEERSAANHDRTKIIKAMTLWHIQLQKNLLDHLARLIFDLMATRYAFERDFDKHWANLRAAQVRIEMGRSKEWEALLRRRQERGKKHRARNFQKAIKSGQVSLIYDV